jgi:hypothetical protein
VTMNFVSIDNKGAELDENDGSEDPMVDSLDGNSSAFFVMFAEFNMATRAIPFWL